jgi:formate hydrogenlyase subunit 4
MILEYSGRHLALIEWAAQIKLLLYSVLLINLFFPFGIAHNFSWLALALSGWILILKLITLIIVLAITETNLAKLRLFRVPFLLNLAFIFGLLAVLNHIILEVG